MTVTNLPDSAASRRRIAFHDLAEVMPEVRRTAQGHQTVGNWSLAQICHHLAETFKGSINGFDLSKHRLKRFFMSRQILRRVLTSGMLDNYTVNAHLNPPASVELDDAVASLEQSISAYQSYSGALKAHPLFGEMPRETWDRVHLVHCAHHLGFAVPHDA